MRSEHDRASTTFDAFVLAHGPELVGFARRLTMDHHRAEDIVQDVLARVGLAWARVSQAGDVRAYVFKAVLNDFLSWRRRLSSRERPVADPGSLGSARRWGQVPGADHGVAERDHMQAALARLPPVQRAVLVLRYYHDQPDAAIAQLIGCRESTVRSHARRALGTLRTFSADRTSEGSRQ